MCGIAGLVARQTRTDIERVSAAMLAAIEHRGPDAGGVFIDERCAVALGSRRLAIIDLSAAGNQPLTSPDGRFVLVFNGEIYNFLELRPELKRAGYPLQSDTDSEVLLGLFVREGIACLERLNGMFAFAIWDRAEQALWLARDRLGKKPLAYSVQSGELVFGSEIQALLKHPNVSRDVRPEGIDYYLRYGYVPAPLSAFQDIQKLPPAHWLCYDARGVHVERYWRPDYGRKRQISVEEADAELAELLRDSVQKRLISDVPLGAFLSGGIDSGVVVATMAGLAEHPVRTFSIGFGEALYDELPLARKVAERYGTRHEEFVVEPHAADVLPMLTRHYGEPFADSSAVPTFILSRLTRQHVTVALNGDGGDELFAGYDRYAALVNAASLDRFVPIPKSSYLFAASHLPAGGDLRTTTARARRYLEGLARGTGARYAGWIGLIDPDQASEVFTDELLRQTERSGAERWLADRLERRNGLSLADAVLFLDLESYLPGDLLVKVDIASMAASLEARSPLLDYRLVEWAAALPFDFKWRRGTSKWLLRRLARQLLPAPILVQPKRGFGVPVATWLRADLRPLVQDLLLSPTGLARGYVRPEIQRQLVADHLEGRRDAARLLWVLLMLELWHREVVEAT